MLRISPLIEKLESRIERKLGRVLSRNRGNLWKYGTLGGLGLYFYSMLVNSIRLGIGSTFAAPGSESVKTLFEWNPVKNLAALFTPTGFGVTFITALMIMLVNKKGYNILSGYKFDKDKRGFDILPDGTHGTSGFMRHKDMDRILEYGKVSELSGTILGKMKDDPDAPDKYADYVTPKPMNGLNEHILIFGASGAGKSRGFVKPFILQCAARKESLILVDPKGEVRREVA